MSNTIFLVFFLFVHWFIDYRESQKCLTFKTLHQLEERAKRIFSFPSDLKQKFCRFKMKILLSEVTQSYSYCWKEINFFSLRYCIVGTKHLAWLFFQVWVIVGNFTKVKLNKQFSVGSRTFFPSISDIKVSIKIHNHSLILSSANR